jgi:hypothetical protein
MSQYAADACKVGGRGMANAPGEIATLAHEFSDDSVEAGALVTEPLFAGAERSAHNVGQVVGWGGEIVTWGSVLASLAGKTHTKPPTPFL